MRLITLLITVVALAVDAPAIAGKGGHSSGDPSITIAAVNGAKTASNPSPAHGSSVTFATATGSLAGWEYPLVELSCYQDKNGNGLSTDLFGGDLVYVQLLRPDAAFTVGGVNWTSGSATCHARLLAYGTKGGQQSVRELARTYDWTAAW